MRLLVTLIQHDHVLIKTEKWATDAHGVGGGVAAWVKKAEMGVTLL